MNTFIIDGNTIQTLEDIYNTLETDFGDRYPHFGRNLDALYDVFSDGYITEITIENSDTLKQNLRNQKKNETTEYNELFEVLRDIPDLKITLG